jgi:hypothetical protein
MLPTFINTAPTPASSGIVVGGVHYMFVNSHVEDGSPLPFLCGIAGDCGVTVRCTKAVVLVVVSASGASGSSFIRLYEFDSKNSKIYQLIFIFIALILAVQADLQSYKAAQELIINDS